MHYCSVNGKLQQSIPVSDRGLAYGDGIFTTGKILNGKVALLPQHIERLTHYCQRLAILNVDFAAIEQEMNFAAASFGLAVIKVLISAGSGGRGYSRIGANQPTIVITIHDHPTHYNAWQQQGISIADANIRLGINPVLAGIKHLNRLEQVFIRQELDQSPVDDLLVFDINDKLIEASSANVFVLVNGQWLTPVLDTAGVAGLARAEILKATNAQACAIYQSTLAQCQEMFICNSVMGIVPIKQYNGISLSTSEAIKIQQLLDL